MYIISISVKLILLLLAGFISRKAGIISKDGKAILMGVVMNVGLPCLVVASFFSGQSDAETLRTFGGIILAAIISFVVPALIGHILYILMGRSDSGAAVKLCATFGNFTFFGIPVAEALYGNSFLLYFNIFGTVIRIFNYTMIIPLLGGKAPVSSLKEKLKESLSPPMVSIVVGLLLYLFHITLPSAVSSAISTLAAITSPLGLMIAGAILAEADLNRLLKIPMAWLVTALRLIVMPAAALGIMLLLRVDETIFKIVLIYMSMPVASLLPSYIMRFRPSEAGERLASVAITLSSILCVITVPLWMYILEYLL